MLTIQSDGTAVADNADGTGLVRDLIRNHGVELADRRLLLLGAGGAARGVIPELLGQNPLEIVIANRTLTRAQDLVRRFADLGELRAIDYADLRGAAFDIVINATSMSLTGDVSSEDGAAGLVAKTIDAYGRLTDLRLKRSA